MSGRVDNLAVWPLRTLPKDIGVALVLVVALALGLLLRLQLETDTRSFNSDNPAFSISYPAGWRLIEETDGAVLRVENPQASSPYKSNVTVETRELDTAGPPTLQELVDRRVLQHDNLTGYHFLTSEEGEVGGAKAALIEYAHVVQPIDTPRSASLPVVVRSREYIVVTPGRTYYFTLAASEADYDAAREQFDRMVKTARVE
jgi:hypothetical protein